MTQEREPGADAKYRGQSEYGDQPGRSEQVVACSDDRRASSSVPCSSDGMPGVQLGIPFGHGNQSNSGELEMKHLLSGTGHCCRPGYCRARVAQTSATPMKLGRPSAASAPMDDGSHMRSHCKARRHATRRGSASPSDNMAGQLNAQEAARAPARPPAYGGATNVYGQLNQVYGSQGRDLLARFSGQEVTLTAKVKTPRAPQADREIVSRRRCFQCPPPCRRAAGWWFPGRWVRLSFDPAAVGESAVPVAAAGRSSSTRFTPLTGRDRRYVAA
jgi:hypothetical protein